MSHDELNDSVSSTHTTATACIEERIESPEDVEENRRLYEANLASAREILATVESMGERQQQWKEELIQHFMVEAYQQQQSDELSGKVGVAEEELLGLPRYAEKVAALAAQQQSGSAAIASWYTNETLLAATPFACCVPYPRGLSDAARQTFAEQIDSFRLRGPFYVETADFSRPLLTCAAALGCAPEASPASNDDKGALYATVGCRTGADVLALIDDSREMRTALDKTPAVLIHDLADGYPSAARRRLGTSRSAADGHSSVLSRGFIVGGVLVAVETAQRRGCPTWASLVGELEQFATANVLPALPQRSFVMYVTSHDTPNGLRHALVGIDHLDRATYDCFSLEELVAAAQARAVCGAPPVLRFALDASHPPIVPLTATLPKYTDPHPAAPGHSSRALVATAMATAAATAALSWAVLRGPTRR